MSYFFHFIIIIIILLLRETQNNHFAEGVQPSIHGCKAYTNQ